MVKHYAFDNDPSCDLCAVVVDANGNYVKREDYDALAARLAEAEALLREWADSGVEYKSSKYRLTQVDHRTYLETVDFLAPDSAAADCRCLTPQIAKDAAGREYCQGCGAVYSMPAASQPTERAEK